MRIHNNKHRIGKRRLIMYIAIIAICIIAVASALYLQFYTRIDLGKMFGSEESKYGDKTEDEIAILETGFENIFNNSVENVSEQNNSKRITDERDLIYTAYENKEEKGNYNMDVTIPQINVDSDIVRKYNQTIKDIFFGKVESIIEEQENEENVVYTVEYVAEIYNDILSLMIISNLKEGASAQRVIVQTYNYDLRNNKEISLNEILDIEMIEKDYVQDMIKVEIKEEQEKTEALHSLGYTSYSRDITDEQYLIENTTEFYLTENELYIIYAYGNETFTSEMDMIIL